MRTDGGLLHITDGEVLRIESDGTETVIGSTLDVTSSHLLPQGTGYALFSQLGFQDEMIDFYDSNGRFVVQHVPSPPPEGSVWWTWCNSLYSPDPGRVLLFEGHQTEDPCFIAELRLAAPDGSDVTVIPIDEAPSQPAAINAHGFYLRDWADGQIALLGNDGNVQWTLPAKTMSVTAAWASDDIAFSENGVVHHVRDGQILGTGSTTDVFPSIDISPNGTYVAAAHRGEQLALFEHGVELWAQPLPDSSASVIVSDRGETLLRTNFEKAELFDKDGNLVWELAESATAAFAPGGEAFVVRLGPLPGYELTYYRIVR
jgi:hypothetical protein